MLVIHLIDRMLHYKYNYQVTKFDVMVNVFHEFLHVLIDSNRDFHLSIFVQYEHSLLIFVFFLPNKKNNPAKQNFLSSDKTIEFYQLK